MKHWAKLDDFYHSLKDISTVNSDLDKKRDGLKKCTYEFNDLIQRKTIDRHILNQNKEMAELLGGIIQSLKESTTTWVANFEEMLEKEKFRSDLQNYFIIIIFGKVKAGKSSLGNFIAKHRLEDQDINFFKYDEAGKEQEIKKLEEIDEDSFDTNNLECTTEIQGFKLGGMAWIDTPGLGSMVKENGDLAKAYIQSADFIIYPTSSDSPLQQDEQQQLKELFEQNKKVTICITKSDETEEDDCECGLESGCDRCTNGLTAVLQNKSLESRLVQESFVSDEINKLISSNKESVLGDIFSISTHAASQGIKTDDSQLFEGSNTPKFYELITKVVKEKSIQLKEETPSDTLTSFINNNILGNGGVKTNTSIKSIKNNLTVLDEKINEIFERFEVLKKNANSDFNNEIENIIAEHSSEIGPSNSKKIFEKIDLEINEKVSQAIQNNISEIFEDFDTTLTNITTSLSTDDFEIQDKHKTIEYSTKKVRSKIGGTFLGALATFGAAVATGGASLVVTGVVMAGGGAVGSAIGAIIGEATGSTHQEKIIVGDNKEEVIQRFKDSQLKKAALSATELYQKMQNLFFEPLQTVSQEIQTDLDTFEKNIKNII